MKNFKANQKTVSKFVTLYKAEMNVLLKKRELALLIESLAVENECSSTKIRTELAKHKNMPYSAGTLKNFSAFAVFTEEEILELGSEAQIKELAKNRRDDNAKNLSVTEFKAVLAEEKAARTRANAEEAQDKAETSAASAKNVQVSAEFKAFQKSAAFTALEDYRYKNAEVFKSIMAEYIGTL